MSGEQNEDKMKSKHNGEQHGEKIESERRAKEQTSENRKQNITKITTPTAQDLQLHSTQTTAMNGLKQSI